VRAFYLEIGQIHVGVRAEALFGWAFEEDPEHRGPSPNEFVSLIVSASPTLLHLHLEIMV
jgi:hypothetical protein